jgi:prepilin-type N-terminal cleavage/methylation domain-containing protein
MRFPSAAPARRPTLHASPAARRGYTLAELMIVLGVAAILMMVAMPRVNALRDASAVRAARLEVAAAVEAARAAAIQRARPARVAFRNNMLVAAVDTSQPNAPSAEMVTLVIQRLDAAYGVTLTFGAPADTALVYGGRGVVAPSRSTGSKYYVTRRNVRDSVCVTAIGLILPRGCAL